MIKRYIEIFAQYFPVKWDRYTCNGAGEYNIYGWFERKDGQRGFILLQIYETDGEIKGGFVTSSAKYSKAIMEYMYGTSGGHCNCIKISELK